MSDSPLVSCIIIFLDPGDYLLESVDSVLAQSYDNWELFLIDDGSTDDSSSIAREYASKYPGKIYYLEHPDHQNRGKNASRNLGIAHARGSYLALLDADDVWLPDKLTEQIELMESNPEAGMIYGRTQIWSNWIGIEEEGTTDSFYDLGVEADTLVRPPLLFLQLLEGWAQTPTTCNALIRSSVVDEIGGFDEDYHDIFEDQAFFAKIELAYPVFVAGNMWAKYRQHQDSSFAQHSQESKQDRTTHYRALLKFLNWIERYLCEQNYKDEQVLKFLRKRQKSALKKLQLIQKPILGRLTLLLLSFTEWSLGIVTQIGRRVLPAPVRHWLWLKIGKKIFVNL
jgi:glycosyltransferase involved in cell wall biosynthesis